MTEPDTDRPKGQLFEEAAGWFARMRAPDAEASRGEFEAWLARGALHRSAYNRAAEIFAMGKLLQEPGADGARTPVRARRNRVPAAAAAAALLCLAAGLGWIGLRQAARPGEGDRPIALASQAHSGAAYRLSDGSVVTLAAASRLTVDITARVRRLTLEDGRGRFRVAHESRPFIVYAGGGSVTARGTVFDVALSSDRRVRVRLIEGVVEVASPGRAAPPRRQRLVAGQSASFAVRGSAQPPGRPQAAAGVHEYDRAALSELIDAANRNSKRPIQILGTVGERRVSGRFRIDDTDLLADRIAALFDLVVDRSDPSVILLKPR